MLILFISITIWPHKRCQILSENNRYCRRTFRYSIRFLIREYLWLFIQFASIPNDTKFIFYFTNEWTNDYFNIHDDNNLEVTLETVMFNSFNDDNIMNQYLCLTYLRFICIVMFIVLLMVISQKLTRNINLEIWNGKR
jgi:hypothetical protein